MSKRSLASQLPPCLLFILCLSSPRNHFLITTSCVGTGAGFWALQYVTHVLTRCRRPPGLLEPTSFLRTLCNELIMNVKLMGKNMNFHDCKALHTFSFYKT